MNPDVIANLAARYQYLRDAVNEAEDRMRRECGHIVRHGYSFTTSSLQVAIDDHARALTAYHALGRALEDAGLEGAVLAHQRGEVPA